jgi:hypothetical protein
LLNDIADAAEYIDFGRKGFAIKGRADEGRVSYEKGIAQAMSAFQEAQTIADPEILILAEYTFINQEFQCCEKTDSYSINSLAKAIGGFDDAFRAFNIVENKALYQGAEATYPHDTEYRVVGGFPKDAFHLACGSHKTRLQNILRTPGIDPIEKALLKQRLANLPTAQKKYIEKQKSALESR